MTTLLLVCILLVALALFFDACNGFHDTAHACATSIASGALTYRQAVIMSGVFNALGAMIMGTAVSLFIPKVVGHGLVDNYLIGSALFAGLVWNLLTWYFAQPVSSTHCLLGSLIGAGLAAGGIHGVVWHELWVALFALFFAPVVGFGLSFLLAKLLIRIVGEPGKNAKVEKWMPRIQVGSAAAVSFAHGSNDGQKTMGIITMILVAWETAQYAADPNHVAMYSLEHVPFWVICASALAIGIGTMVGGARIIHTVGHKLSNKQITSYDGCVAELVTAFLVCFGGKIGLPVSTTHTCTSAVLGASKGVHGGGMNRATIKKMAMSWVVTFPVTAIVAAVIYLVAKAVF